VSNLSDADLVARAQRGDRGAFGDLYERHLDAIFRYVYYRVGEQREAEDLTETVFLKAWEALDRYKASAVPFTAWLYRIAHNLLIDRHRAFKEETALPDDHADHTPHTNPEAEAQRHLEQAALTTALAQLEPDHQHVLTLRFINDLSHAETARIMGRTEGAVRVLQHRALAALRQLLGPEAFA
jgi:RNA polymerase sigma-70 factor (ECF subfamily)